MGLPTRYKWLKGLVLLVIGVSTALLVYHALASRAVRQFDASLPRDPETGIIEGAAPQWLGPEDSKTAVLFVHGFVGVGNNFADLPSLLAKQGFRVREMLLPGHGTTPIEFRDSPKEAFRAAVLEEIVYLKHHHEKVFLVSHSMGAAITTLAASETELDGIVLGAPYYKVSFKWYYVLPVEAWTKVTAPFIKWVYKSDSFIRVRREEAKKEIISYRWIPSKASLTLNQLGANAYNENTLKNVTEPVLMLVSDGDNAADPEAARNAFSLIASKDKTLVELDNSDHHIYWDYDREQVYSATIDFISRIANTN